MTQRASATQHCCRLLLQSWDASGAGAARVLHSRPDQTANPRVRKGMTSNMVAQSERTAKTMRRTDDVIV
jgi:hypothetical protein